MNRIMIIAMAAVLLMTACRKEELSTFNNPGNNIYFNLEPYGYKDSLLYSFAYHPEKAKDTIWVPLRISGNRVNRAMAYAVKVIDSSTSAEVNKHYEPLKDQYLFPADSGSAFMPVILYSADTMLLDRSYSLTIQLVPTGDLNTGLTQLLTARIVFSNRLEKPKWWDQCPGGNYSIVKHQLFRLAATTEDVTTDPLATPIRIYYNDRFKALLANPKTWIANNPDKGYEIQERPDGNYNFYYSGTPDKKMLYRKNPNSGTFYFVDENGKDVI
ncbi:DUF4843 domain-containing protein [Longitalea arenae]|uniref:DUF4843 domain-containing protein n=1 Tax=Longitalea arenae TaxID=2812558 RepID=UPI001966E658|nr:DUF4843 domain-containing protein [Longitalea arenae]